MTTVSQLTYFIRADLFRYGGGCGAQAFVKNILINPGFQFTFWLRCRSWVVGGNLLRRIIFCWTRLILRRLIIKYGIALSPYMVLGPGLHIGHIGGIVVNERAIIGRNCNLSHGVTLGQTNRGKHFGFPVVGNNVYIGPGAKIIGGITIGNNVAVGANAVATRDVPDFSVVVGIPAKVISQEGSVGYVNDTDYDNTLNSQKSAEPGTRI